MKTIHNPHLSKVFDVLFPLKDTENIEVSYEVDPHNQLEINVKPNGDSRLYKIAATNNIPL